MRCVVAFVGWWTAWRGVAWRVRGVRVAWRRLRVAFVAESLTSGFRRRRGVVERGVAWRGVVVVASVASRRGVAWRGRRFVGVGVA
ncbi:hypothetical protein ACXZ9C_10770 [Streptococcus agalactiae]